MKFTTSKGNDPIREPVAFLTKNGSLVVRNEKAWVSNCSHLFLRADGTSTTVAFDPKGENVDKLFYPGDTLTITF